MTFSLMYFIYSLNELIYNKIENLTQIFEKQLFLQTKYQLINRFYFFFPLFHHFMYKKI